MLTDDYTTSSCFPSSSSSSFRLAYRDVEIHEVHEKNEPTMQKKLEPNMQRRLVLIPNGSKLALDMDFGVTLNAQEYEFGIIIKPKTTYMPVVVRVVQGMPQSDSNIAMFPRLFYRGDPTPTPSFPPEGLKAITCKADSEIDWFYFSDGRHELMFGFRPEENIKEIGKNFVILSLLKGGIIHPVLVLKLISKDTNLRPRFVDVTGASK